MEVIYSPVSEKTGKLIEENMSSYDLPVIFRWGTTTRKSGLIRTLPSRRSVKRCSQKDVMIKMLDRAGVRTPYLKRPRAADFPLFMKKPGISHSGSGLIYVCSWQEYLQLKDKKYYATKYIKSCAEIRCVVAFGKVVDTFKKINNDSHSIIRNILSDYKYVRINESPPCSKISIQAAKALGIDICASDIIIGQDGLLYLLEINSAPGLTSHKKTVRAICDQFVNNYRKNLIDTVRFGINKIVRRVYEMLKYARAKGSVYCSEGG